MKSVVITGAARGLGYCLAEEFVKNNYNVVISDILDEELEKSKEALSKLNKDVKVISVKCDVSLEEDLEKLLNACLKEFKSVDIWINNAGVNQPMVPVWELEKRTIDKLIDIDLKGTIMGTNIAIRQMKKQGYGQVYGVEGHGSNDAKIMGLSMYGTTKRALTYFLEATAKELDEEKLNIQVGLLAPGIMITKFTNHALGNDKMELSDKTKKVYNILGDYPDVIARFLVDKMIKNTKNGARFSWLTNRKAFFRFMVAGFNKRDFFKD